MYELGFQVGFPQETFVKSDRFISMAIGENYSAQFFEL